MRRLGYRIIACSVGSAHLHAVVELPANYTQVRSVVGKCKQKASHAVRDVLPGSIWSEGGECREVRDAGHLRNAYGYVRTKQERGTIVWSHRPDENWLDDVSVGVVVMGMGRKQLRMFGFTPDPPDAPGTLDAPDGGV